ncbi:MAG: cation transporter [Arachnia propionica]|nr:MAG: cation transporter [Arachnia propionica]
MSHDHSHDHSHHDANTSRTRLAIAFAITAGVLIAEVIGALLTGSLALLTDAGHMLTDAGGLLMALLAAGLMTREPTDRRTWGWLRIEVLAAGAQATLLLIVGIYALIEGVRRLVGPVEVEPTGMLILGIVGLVANVAAMLVLSGSRSANLNLRAAFLEVVNDALGSVAVIVSALAVQFFGWHRADAVAGIIIALLIVPRAIRILREAGEVLLESAPPSLDLGEVRRHLLNLEHVREIHDLHASRVSTNLPVITAHIIVEEECFHDGHAPEILKQLATCVAEHFAVSIEHSTFQLEPPGFTPNESVHHH